MDRKSLCDISWNVDEPTYRADSALSYSTLAKYERSGFNDLEHLFDKVETPSLTFGSAVDSIITDGQEGFDKRFMIAEIPSIPDSIIKIIKSLFEEFNQSYRTLDNIPNEEVIRVANTFNYQTNWKPETRAKVIKEKGLEYYNLLYVAENRTILDTSTYQDVCNAVKALEESGSTKYYFQKDNPFEPNIERLYQLKFKASFNGIDYRCMMDECIVLHDKKLIIPIDLKTSSHTEWDFYKSFLDWSYMIQARLYARILKANIEKDDYFKDFTIANYRFIVINKKTLTPLVWNYNDTFTNGTLYYGKQENIICRDPFTIGEELHYYLSSRPKVPIGIEEAEINELTNWINNI